MIVQRNCCEGAIFVIDLKSNDVVCGVSGTIIEAQEVRILKGNVSCAKCGNTIYSDEENKH
jgi:hypothetical protein